MPGANRQETVFHDDRTELLERIEALRADFREFAYRVAHDVNTPMRAVANFSHLVAYKYKDGVLDEEAQDYLRSITQGIEHSQRILAALFEYSHINTLNNPPVDTDCNLLLERCLSKFNNTITRQNALITSELLPNIIAEEQQLEKLLCILIENALTFHFPKRDPVITIEVQELSDFWLFSVADNGIGIAPENLEEIFQMFYCLHQGIEHSGIGIGLALARKIIHHHRGRIWVSSQPGKGSIFYFCLPLGDTLLHKGLL